MEKALSSPERPRAVGYVRVSSKKQRDEGGSLEDQRESLIRHAVLTGLDLVEVFEDGGISGGKGEDKRPGLNAALEAVKSGTASVLIVKHIDRLARETDLAGFLRTSIKRAGGSLVIVDEAKADPYRRLLDGMLAEMERLRARERMKFTYAAKKQRGEWVGPVPYGYRLGANGSLVPEPSEAPTVERITALRERGESLRAIAETLNRSTVPTHSGKPWNAQTVNSILGRNRGTRSIG